MTATLLATTSLTKNTVSDREIFYGKLLPQKRAIANEVRYFKKIEIMTA